MRFRWFLMLSLFVAQDTRATEEISFDRDIRPILSENCFFCHGPDEKKRKAGLRLDIHSSAKDVIGRGDLQNSELHRRIHAGDADIMPPRDSKISLSPKEKSRLTRWIEQGGQYDAHWAFVAPKKWELPPLHDSDQTWARNGIDHFIAERLRRAGLRPSAAASKETLIRRVSLDLTGLPPTLTEVDAFLADTSVKAFERVADRLLASQRFGERMALVWMDIARYADTGGYQGDVAKTQWPWRDWVIAAYNRNLSFEQFTIQQLAGDLLPDRTPEMQLASAFNRNHRINDEGGIIPEEWRIEYVADRVETTGTTWLGLTVGCARCHNHKYDPISHREYYQMFAFFNNVSEQGKSGNVAPLPNMDVYTGGSEGEHAELKSRAADLRKQEPAVKRAKKKRVTDWTARELKRIADDSVFSNLPAPLLHAPLDFKQKNYYFDARNRKRKLNAVGRRLRAVTSKTSAGGVQFTQGAYIRTDNPHPDGKFSAARSTTWSMRIGVAGRDLANVEGPIACVVADDKSELGYQILLEDVDEKKPYRIVVRIHHDVRDSDGIEVATGPAIARKGEAHLAVTYDGSRRASGIRIYVNGKALKLSASLDSLTGEVETGALLVLGTDSEAQSRANFRDATFSGGQLFDLQVFGQDLTPPQVVALATAEPVDSMFLGGAEGDVNRFLETHYLKAVDAEYQQLLKKIAQAEAALAKFEKTSITKVSVMDELKIGRPTYLLERGAYDHPDTNEVLVASTFATLPAMAGDLPMNRLGLAKWLFQDDHPLTGRVAMNRYWLMYFGTGLVKTVEDFGSQGERPSHQELLDWLAVAFRESGWDIKAMQKLIVMSATYRQSSKVTPELWARDPENRLLARGPRFRLYGQALRDQALAVSGLLKPAIGGKPVMPYQPAGLWEDVSAKGVQYLVADGDALYRRSMYTFWRRTVPPPSMMNFDNASREICSVKSPRTNTPLQAMNLMNDPQFVEAARCLAERMMREGGESVEERLIHGHRLVLARRPDEAVLRILKRGYADYRTRFAAAENDAKAFIASGKSKPDATLDAIELAANTAVANILLNLDETVTKE
ncbi:MAG: hypothetical protein ACI9OD_000641 [Limisphaerales bacterium]|jgi:hypothetical protein